MVLIRADGNLKIGTGHIMRCLSLADAFQEKGVRSTFIIAEPYMQSLIQKRGYECLLLNSAYDHMENELPAFLPILEENQPACVVLDSYFATPDYMRAIQVKAPLIYIDDLNLFDYPADVVVNYNLYGEDIAYPPGKTYFLGPQYAPLRKQFQGLALRAVKEQVHQFLFSTGGTDPYHVALRSVEYLCEHPPDLDAVYHFILGPMNQDAEQIRETAVNVPCVMLHQQVSDMRALMLQCDMAVSAGGTTLYELCACGLPTVTYILADNQIQGTKAFEAAGLMPCAGDVRKNPLFVRRIFSILDEISDWKRRKETVQRMQALVDGNGAGRLAEEIYGLLEAGRGK